jgi:hypothetical protein
MSEIVERQESITNILISYGNIIGYSFIISFLICWGLSCMFPKQKLLNKAMVCGLALVLMGVMLFIRKIPFILG